jgi:hypothetical protein
MLKFSVVSGEQTGRDPKAPVLGDSKVVEQFCGAVLWSSFV